MLLTSKPATSLNASMHSRLVSLFRGRLAQWPFACAGGSEDRVVQIGVREDEVNKGTAQEALFQCCKSMEHDESAQFRVRMLVPKPQVSAGACNATHQQLC